MAEPARKLEDIEPDIRPNLHVIEGGGNATPERANLRALENQESSPEKPSTDSVSEQEANGSNVIQGPWANNVSGDAKESPKSNGRFSFIKKKGPLALITTIILTSGVGVSLLFLPSFLIVQLKEVMVHKFNAQLASMDVRTTRMLRSKTTNGSCGTIVILCKYSSMSDKQIANFEKAGIKVNSEKTTILGQKKPISFEFEGKTVIASGFSDVLTTDPKFRTAVKIAYNPKFAGFADNIWSKVVAKFGISKKAAHLDGGTDEERLKNIQEDVKGTNKTSRAQRVNIDETNSDGSLKYTQEEVADINKLADEANKIIDEAETAGIKGTKATTAVLGGVGVVTSTLKVTGIADNACTVYRTIEAIGYSAKTVRALQLARYAMIFLNVADQIKAGTAKPEDVSYLGKILTTESSDATGKRKSASDSFGYKFTTYGDTGNMPTSAMQFMAGGGLAGGIIALTSELPKPGKGVCKVLANPFVGLASLIAGISFFFIPGFNAAMTWKTVAQGVLAGGAVAAATAYLPALLKDIIAGNLVDVATVGENAGDAITSGASGMMGTSAKFGGNAPLMPEQAVDYGNLTDDIATQYAEEDRIAHSPFDATNSNTFMGKIVAQLVPYASKMSSLSGVLSSIASITTRSLASITSPITKAADSNIKEFTMCQDTEYMELKVATDPYCNITYGIPPDALNADPVSVATDLLTVTDPVGGKHPQITTEGKPTDKYTTFISNCINRDEPLYKTISSGADTTDNAGGSECMFGADVFIDWYQPPTPPGGKTPPKEPFYISNKNFYLYYIDQRVESGMDGV